MMKQQYLMIDKFFNVLYIYDKKGRVVSFTDRYASCFILTLRGKIRFSFADTSITTDSSQGIFIPQGTSYSNECLEEAESIVINFYAVPPMPSPCSLNGLGEQTAMGYFQKLQEKAFEQSESAHYYLLAELYSVAHLLFGREEHKSTKQILAEKMFLFIQNEFTRSSLQVSDMADHCNISEVYLRKICNEIYGKSPFAMLTEYRMKKAYEMVRERIPAKKIALSVGYADIYQFSRAFKRYYGYAPTESPLITTE